MWVIPPKSRGREIKILLFMHLHELFKLEIHEAFK